MNMKKTPTPAIERAVARSVNFELSIADIARRSERRAWLVAFSAIGMALILAGGYFYMLPLKQKVPYLVMADAYTGTATVAQLTGDFNTHRITTSEAVNRSNVAHFVLARESYDLAMLNLRDWKTVQTMASPGVKAEYTGLYSSNNPDSLYKQYGKDRAIRIKLLSIVLLGGQNGTTPRGATVRFQRSLYNKATGSTQPMDSKIATIEFTYKSNLDMDDQSRIENPLGFWVTSYRVDNDYAAAPPAEVVDQSLPPTTALSEPPSQSNAPASASSTPAAAVPPTPAPGVASR
jgi:type IV secretion system protein VirB8